MTRIIWKKIREEVRSLHSVALMNKLSHFRIFSELSDLSATVSSFCHTSKSTLNITTWG